MDQIEHTQDSHRSNKPSQTMVYEIRIQGQLDSTWSDWFDGLRVTAQGNGETLITGPLPDQASLSGVLMKVFDLKLTLLSVRRTNPGS